MDRPDWQWNEIQQIGTDYADLAEVESYDARIATVCDVDEENRAVLAKLNLPDGAAVLEIGCGTGRFSRMAAGAGLRVSAADVSSIMLDYVRSKAAQEDLGEIATQHAGFITMDFPAASFDAVVTGRALHHLPDAWKLVGLRNVARVLKPGGQLHLADVVFSPPAGEAPENTFDQFAHSFNEQMYPMAARHVAVEYSTYDWILEGLLQRAGFEILSTEQACPSFFIYHCRKS